MKRRDFAKLTALTVVAFSTVGFVRFNGESYEGDCETTTDVLGPFYRPDSPVRSNLVMKNSTTQIIKLSGIVKHKDCVTPYKGAKVELWHCDDRGKYDNSKETYNYRGTTYCDENGNYSFKTIMPVPYAVGDGTIRPAHFHLLISAHGYQSLVTQLYFIGDPYIETDLFASLPNAKKRILSTKNSINDKKYVTFNVNMSDKLMINTAVIDKLTGIYFEDKTGKRIELIKKFNKLWEKNEVFGDKFEYIGNNTFEYPNLPENMKWKLHFEFLKNGTINLTEVYNNNGKENVTISTKKSKN